ncbi:hypothetical protein DAPPUDRAFT_317509 [Daphnia pulex]|uniref:Uncharacterized protein n=1 Tax=Daphnia pulex TaxID=6669 RepID=E9GG57_DAPPU|nr:hypothetical protein DAPPUDRAFT_317509 [Daphnia pulex]|eukprot:EFX81552.1 hypothetical protein DAPPUDRAFT_317509 [Daphnia pulex]
MIGGFQQFRIDGQLKGNTVVILRKIVNITIGKVKAKSQSCKERSSLYQIPFMVDVESSALDCVTPTEIESSIFKAAGNLVEVKKHDFLLQKNYRQQAKHEESKMEHRLNEEKLREEDAEIKKCRDLRRVITYDVQKRPLLLLFLYMLSNEDPSSRVLSIRLLEKVLAERSKLELERQLLKVRELYSSYVEKQANNQSISEDATDQLLTKENWNWLKINFARLKLN